MAIYTPFCEQKTWNQRCLPRQGGYCQKHRHTLESLEGDFLLLFADLSLQTFTERLLFLRAGDSQIKRKLLQFSSTREA